MSLFEFKSRWSGKVSCTIDATLPSWLTRRQGQGILTIVPTGD